MKCRHRAIRIIGRLPWGLYRRQSHRANVAVVLKGVGPLAPVVAETNRFLAARRKKKAAGNDEPEVSAA
jgi:hypothetical protein